MSSVLPAMRHVSVIGRRRHVGKHEQTERPTDSMRSRRTITHLRLGVDAAQTVAKTAVPETDVAIGSSPAAGQ